MDSIDKVVRLLDTKEQQSTEDKACYTFANLDQDDIDLDDINLKIEEASYTLVLD